jgi:hypothetical protein
MKALNRYPSFATRAARIAYPSNRLKLVALLCLAGCLRAGAATDWIAQLSSTNIEVRRVAIDLIQTLDDPRIPEACLPLLQDEGYSIRRQAARAIGSRYYQIRKARLPFFISAMQKCRQDFPPGMDAWDLQGDQRVVDRGIGLLTDKLDGDAFSVSPNKKWVLYEQRRLPMIADTKLLSRELLAPSVPPDLPYEMFPTRVDHGNLVEELGPAQRIRLLKLMCTAGPVGDLFHPQWSPTSAGLVIQPAIQEKFFTPICLWRSRDGAYRVFAVNSFQKFYGNRFPHWGTIIDFVRWRGSKVFFRIYDCDYAGEGPYDPTGILVSVDIRDWSTALEKK